VLVIPWITGASCGKRTRISGNNVDIKREKNSAGNALAGYPEKR
jgi:hypothetical protein